MKTKRESVFISLHLSLELPWSSANNWNRICCMIQGLCCCCFSVESKNKLQKPSSVVITDILCSESIESEERIHYAK